MYGARMNKPVSITTEVDVETLAMVERVAIARGISREAFAAEAIRRAAESDTDFAAFLQAGEDSVGRGDYREHDDFIADLRMWRKTRVRPH